MAEEKRVQLGVDIGELSNQLVQINSLVEQNYQKALQGQAAYNKILEESISLLERQSELVQGIGDSLQNSLSNQGSIPIMGSGTVGGEQDKQNDLKDIEENIENIWEFLSELGNPIPVEVRNTPLQVKVVEGNSGQNSGGGSDSDNSGGNSNRNQGNSDGGGRSVKSYVDAASAAFQKDPNFMLPAVAGMIPVVGSAVSSILSKILTEAEAKERASARLRGTTGGGFNLGEFEDIGLSLAEAMQKEAAYYRQNINLSRSDLYFERGWNLDAGTMGSILQSLRKDLINPLYPSDREYDSSSVVAYRYLQGLSSKGGIMEEEVRGYSEEYLRLLVDINQKQLDTTGKTYSMLNSDFIQSIAQLNSNFEDPVRLSRVVNTLYSGLQQANSPQMEAMQYYALSQVNPNASLWEMQLMREDPTGRGRGYFSNLMNLLMQTGNEQDVKFNIMNAFGLKATDVEDMLEGIKGEMETNPNFDLVQYLENSRFTLSSIKGKGIEEGKILAEGRASTATAEVGIAKMSDIMANLGTPLLNIQGQILTKIEKVISIAEDFFNQSGESTSSIIKNRVKNLLGLD